MLDKLFKYAPVQIFSALSVFLLIAIQTRHLTLQDYGFLAVLLIFLEVTRIFTAQWITVSLIRLLPSKNKEKKSEILSLSFYLLLSLVVPGCMALAVCILFLNNFNFLLWLSISFLLITKSFFLYFQELSRLAENVKNYRNSVLLQSLLSIIFTFIALQLSATIYTAIVALVLSYTVPIIISWKLRPKLLDYNAHNGVNEFVSYGIPLLFSGVLVSLNSRVDRLVINELISLDAVGVYAAISNMLSGIMGLIFLAVAMPLYPELTKSIDNKAKLYRTHQKYLDLLLLVSFPALIGLCLLAESLMQFVLGSSFQMQNSNVFYLLCCSVFILNFKTHFIEHGLQFQLKTTILPWLSFVIIILNVSLAFILIGTFKLLGAALAVLISEFCALALSWYFAVKFKYCFPVPKNIIKTMIASTLMAMVLLAIKPFMLNAPPLMQLVTLTVIGVLTYSISHLLLNTMQVRNKFLNGFSK